MDAPQTDEGQQQGADYFAESRPRAPGSTTPGSQGPGAPLPTQPRAARWLRLIGLAAVAVVTATLVRGLFGPGGAGGQGGHGGLGGSGAALAQRVGAVAADGRLPTPRRAASDVPLSSARPAPYGGGAHRFVALQPDGSGPVAYDPCRPLAYVVNPRLAPPGADALLADAIAELSAVTGLQFTFEGLTDEAPSTDRASFQAERYGDRWAPILVAWTDGTEVPALSGETAGLAGSTALHTGGTRVYVSGMVALDGGQLTGLQARRGDEEVRGVVVHELGHLVGLDHVDDSSQLMYDRIGQTRLAAGDLTGLAALGRGTCVERL